VYSMNDIVNLPFTIVELGQASFAPKAPSQSALAASPQLGTVMLINGNNLGLVQLQGSSGSFSVDLGGDPLGLGRIVASCFLRVHLWPLTLWTLPTTGSACSAWCYAPPGKVCGPIPACTAQKLVPQGTQSPILKLQLPASMTPFSGTIRHTITVSNLVLPTMGWFPSRLSVEVSDTTDQNPSFSLVQGNYLWMAPPAGATWASVIATGANALPFQGQSGNTLYVQIVLGATLYRQSQSSNVGSLLIKLPFGYQCKQVAVSETQQVFYKTGIPNGRVR
jgi:hypothetical protein